jgi:hypothetical protein
MRHNLRIAIERKFHTQLACARAVGIHPVRMNRICCGWVDPTPIERDRIVAALDADPAWLFTTVTHIPGRASSGIAHAAPAATCAGRES